MNTQPQPPLTAEQIELFISMSQARYMVALLLMCGLVLVALGTTCFALGWRKTGFLFTAGYGLAMTFIGVGFCYLVGPFVACVAVLGLVREWLALPKRAKSASPVR